VSVFVQVFVSYSASQDKCSGMVPSQGVRTLKSENLRYIFTECYWKRSKWIAAIHRNNWTPVSERWIWSYHFVSICWF